jgi:phosphate transport system permease protein
MRIRDTHFQDRVFIKILRFISWSMILIMAGIFLLLLKLALPVILKFGWGFFFSTDWNPPSEVFGALPFIYGTLMSSLLAIIIATPISLGVALFLTELAPRSLRKIVSFFVEMLAAIPSVVFGLWGVFILVPFMQKVVQPKLIYFLGPHSNFASALARILTAIGYPFVLVGQVFHLSDLSLEQTSQIMLKFSNQLFSGPSYGVGLLTGSIILAIMITPTISSIAREVFSSVSSQIREASLALGATRWEMISLSVIRSCKSGILGAVILGLGRALGETMAVTMVIGNRNEIRAALLAPAQTMASLLANEYNEASGQHLSALVGIGLSLLVISLLVNSVARLIVWRVERFNQ